jgi:hypothetical protein
MPDYYEFDVRLQHIEPTIWRRFQLPTDASFLDLHYAIQAACGWDNAHLYAFRTTRGRTIAGIPMDTWGTPDPDAAEVRLSTFFSGSPKCIYEYDFGDSWLHDVARVGVVSTTERFQRRLLDGARAFPPEDCGGLWGYEDCVRVFNGGEDPDERGEWMGDWDPEYFDLEQTRKAFDC